MTRTCFAAVLALCFASTAHAQDPQPAAAAPETPADAASAAPQAAPAAASPVAISEVMPLVTTQALILDFAAADSRAVAVGERGQILLSESRSDWRQATGVPTRANLTAVSAVGDKVWAVGHDGTILHSADGGSTWSVQRSDPWHAPSDSEPFDPRQGVPLLDILMLDENNGFAVGAYSLLLNTVDGGTTWSAQEINAAAEGVIEDVVEEEAPPPADETVAGEDESWTFSDEDLELEEESDPHLNAIARTGDGSLFIVAERGAAYRSSDAGATWERIQLPYEGSMFGVIGYEGQHVLAFGMRGNAFESNDLGTTWQQIDTGTELSLMGGAPLEGGGAALVGANGAVLHRAAAGQPFRLLTFQTKAQETPVLASVLAQSSSALVVGGEKGVGQFQVPAQ